jgi:hypothetical protein
MTTKYENFLKTDLWKQTTESVFARAGGQCERCYGMEGVRRQLLLSLNDN